MIKSILYKSIFIQFLIIINNVCVSQNIDFVINNEQISFISFVESYPDNQNKNKKKLVNKISNVIVGEKINDLNKPISIYAENINEYYINSQGNQSVIFVKNKVGEMPRILKKEQNSFFELVGISKFVNNSFLVTDSYSNKLFIVSKDKKNIKLLNDSLALNHPTGIAFSPTSEEIYVVQTGSHKITVLDKSGKIIREIGSRGIDEGKFNYPTFICIDNLGIIYVVDSMNFRIQIFNSKGEFINAFGEEGDASGYFARPKGIAVDSFGNIYVADALFNTIQIFDKKGNFLFNFGEKGNADGQFFMPAGIFIDKENYLYVADSYNSRVQIFKINKAK